MVYHRLLSCPVIVLQGLRHATQLELLSYRTSIPTLLELDLLAALPALTHLWVRTAIESISEEERICTVLHRHLPHLRQATLWVDADDSGFWVAGDALLGIRS